MPIFKYQMSQFTSNNNLENLYVNSACVTGPTIDNLIVAPCVNEEYQEPHFKPENNHDLEEYLLKDELDERVEEYRREEEERYDEMIAVERLKDIDLNERIDNYRVYFEERETELLKECQDEDIKSYFKLRAMRWRKHWQKENDVPLNENEYECECDDEYYEYIFAGEKERYRNTFTEEEWDAIMLDKAVSKANVN